MLYKNISSDDVRKPFSARSLWKNYARCTLILNDNSSLCYDSCLKGFRALLVNICITKMAKSVSMRKFCD